MTRAISSPGFDIAAVLGLYALIGLVILILAARNVIVRAIERGCRWSYEIKPPAPQAAAEQPVTAPLADGGRP